MSLVQSDVAAMVDDGFIVDMTLLNFSKEFDILSHTVLLEKLNIVAPAV